MRKIAYILTLLIVLILIVIMGFLIKKNNGVRDTLDMVRFNANGSDPDSTSVTEAPESNQDQVWIEVTPQGFVPSENVQVNSPAKVGFINTGEDSITVASTYETYELIEIAPSDRTVIELGIEGEYEFLLESDDSQRIRVTVGI